MLITPQEKKKQREHVPVVAVQNQRSGVFLPLAASVILGKKVFCALVSLVK